MSGRKTSDVTWDVTVVSTLADSYLHASVHSPGCAAAFAASLKESKYTALTTSHVFQPVALETLAIMDCYTFEFLSALGRRLRDASGDPRETSFLFGLPRLFSLSLRVFKENLQLHKSPSLVPSLPFPSLPFLPLPSPPLPLPLLAWFRGYHPRPPENFWN